MEKFTKLTSRAAFLPIANIDTDMIIAKQYLKTIKRSGLGKWLFAALRYDGRGEPVPSFPLNQTPDARILLAGDNFGCGSSREHAPWSLLDFGIRVIIAPSFADIFYNNCFKNGLLPLKLEDSSIQALADSHNPITVDLESQTVSCDSQSFGFSIEPSYKQILLEGLDDIAAVLTMQDDIKHFEQKHFEAQPWLLTSLKG